MGLACSPRDVIEEHALELVVGLDDLREGVLVRCAALPLCLCLCLCLCGCGFEYTGNCIVTVTERPHCCMCAAEEDEVEVGVRDERRSEERDEVEWGGCRGGEEAVCDKALEAGGSDKPPCGKSRVREA